MQWLGSIIFQLLKWILPLVIHDLIKFIKELAEEKRRKKQDQAIEKLKNAQSEEEQKDALRDIVNNS